MRHVLFNVFLDSLHLIIKPQEKQQEIEHCKVSQRMIFMWLLSTPYIIIVWDFRRTRSLFLNRRYHNGDCFISSLFLLSFSGYNHGKKCLNGESGCLVSSVSTRWAGGFCSRSPIVSQKYYSNSCCSSFLISTFGNETVAATNSFTMVVWQQYPGAGARARVLPADDRIKKTPAAIRRSPPKTEKPRRPWQSDCITLHENPDSQPVNFNSLVCYWHDRRTRD